LGNCNSDVRAASSSKNNEEELKFNTSKQTLQSDQSIAEHIYLAIVI